MNNSRTFAAVLSGLTLLAVSAVAQSSTGGSATGSRSGAATTRSGTSSATTPASTATSPSTETAPSSVTSSPSSTTSGSMNSSANSSTNANSNSFGPGASQFKTIDTDGDHRISRAEFTASGSAALSADTGSSQDTSATASTDSAAKGEKKHWWSRRSTEKSSDMDPTATFDQLDTDHDGFLSESELASANAKLKK